MTKERLCTFFDAVLAIIMTILVLDLEVPENASFPALLAMKKYFFCYALSFFWLGTLWIRLNRTWSRAEYVNNGCMVWSLVVLFFSSFFPFATRYVSEYYDALVPEASYALLTVFISLACIFLNRSLADANTGNPCFEKYGQKILSHLKISFWLKLASFFMALVLPKLTMWFVMAGIAASLMEDLLPGKSGPDSPPASRERV